MNTSDKIKQILKTSPIHAVFVSEAINKYCDELLKDREESIKQINEQGFINGEDWVDIAVDCKNKLK